jgi:hypothetical protein
LSGFTFRRGETVITTANNGSITIKGKGTSPSVRVDHCNFDQLYAGTCIFIDGCLYGVVDHCTFDIGTNAGASLRVYHTSWGNQPSGWGSWADPPFWGSEKFVFFEDNVVNNHTHAPERGDIDSQHGGRWVARHNIFNDCNLFYHGTDNGSAAPQYNLGTRAVEIYNNAFVSGGQRVSAGQDRGGPLVWHDNTYTGNYGGGMGLAIYRQTDYYAKGLLGADGTSPWDLNATEPDGTHVDGHPPYTYAKGTHIGPNDSTIITVSGSPWRLNQWVGYSVTNTNSASPYFHGFSWIVSNNNNTITIGAVSKNTVQGKFNTGDTFAIHKVLAAIGQPGRGQGDLIVGNPPTHLPAPAWPHQAIEPCYSWNNTLNGQNLNFSYNAANKLLRENVDFYNNTPMPGYKPYVYPHPLTKESRDSGRPSTSQDKNQ